MDSPHLEADGSLGDKKEPCKTTRNRFCLLVVADDCVARKALVELVNREPDIVVYAKAQSVDEAPDIMDKQQVDCAIVSMLSNHAGYSFAEEVALRNPELVLLTVTWNPCCSGDGSGRLIGEEIIAQEVAKDIVGAVSYVRTLIRTGIRGFVLSSRITESATHFQAC